MQANHVVNCLLSSLYIYIYTLLYLSTRDPPKSWELLYYHIILSIDGEVFYKTYKYLSCNTIPRYILKLMYNPAWTILDDNSSVIYIQSQCSPLRSFCTTNLRWSWVLGLKSWVFPLFRGAKTLTLRWRA